jgi:hypothetical protein
VRASRRTSVTKGGRSEVASPLLTRRRKKHDPPVPRSPKPHPFACRRYRNRRLSNCRSQALLGSLSAETAHGSPDRGLSPKTRPCRPSRLPRSPSCPRTSPLSRGSPSDGSERSGLVRSCDPGQCAPWPVERLVPASRYPDSSIRPRAADTYVNSQVPGGCLRWIVLAVVAQAASAPPLV